METKDWVLLIKNQTSGPFTKSEVEQLLSSGNARYSDFIWSSQLTKWHSIHELSNANWDVKSLGTPPEEPAATPVVDLFSDVISQPRERPLLAFVEEEPREAGTENLAFSPLSKLVDEIIWDEPVDMIKPLRIAQSAHSSRLLHLTQSFGFSIRNSEKTFLLGWFFVISGLLMLFAFIF